MNSKEYLSRYRHLDAAINVKLEQCAELRRKAQTVSGNSGGTHSTSPYDRIGETTAKIVDLEREINGEIDRLISIQREVLSAISTVQEQRLRTLLELRYINRLTFEEIAVKMNYSYKQVCRLHGQALAQVTCP